MTSQDRGDSLLARFRVLREAGMPEPLIETELATLDEAMAKAAPRIVQVGDHDIERFVA